MKNKKTVQITYDKSFPIPKNKTIKGFNLDGFKFKCGKIQKWKNFSKGLHIQKVQNFDKNGSDI